MSKDGNNNLFGGHPNFQTSSFDPNLYTADMPMQFAATVPRRPQHQQKHNLNMNFGNNNNNNSNNNSFHNPDVLIQQHPNFTVNYTGGPYERPESVNSCTTTTTTSAVATTTNKQIQSKAERRAEHNAIERARRESLNVKFQQLAFTLPNLQNDSRPSKSTIIDRTLDFVKGAISKEGRMQYRIQELEKFNRYLLAELDKKTGGGGVSSVETKQEEEEQEATSPPQQPTYSSSPAPGSVMSEDSFSEEMMKADSPPPPPLPALSFNTKKNGITNNCRMAPVSRSSVTMIPKFEFNHPPTATTSWSGQQMILDQQFHHHQNQQASSLMLQKFQNHEDNTTFVSAATQQQYVEPPIYDYNNMPFMNQQKHHLLLQHRRH